ncbi:hypothetical protein CIFAM_10_03850 [Citrobacter farmeri GTC 1319]|uniref:hypothetical protein n=1 Tax=Citrobacter farmeri TaxID=67824 RepID=UPI00050FEBCF|nr:hypothetical protein [Citrobacter farmeri]GAL50136.1 hypothetical protein CIFAM_10_03850 [Citrobacter farmeri GTC 1319]
MWSVHGRFASEKTQRNEGKCNQLCKLSLTVTDCRNHKKKPAQLAQAGVIRVLNPKVGFTYQYLWDLNFIKPPGNVASEQSQQPFAKCN